MTAGRRRGQEWSISTTNNIGAPHRQIDCGCWQALVHGSNVLAESEEWVTISRCNYHNQLGLAGFRVPAPKIIPDPSIDRGTAEFRDKDGLVTATIKNISDLSDWMVKHRVNSDGSECWLVLWRDSVAAYCATEQEANRYLAERRRKETPTQTSKQSKVLARLRQTVWEASQFLPYLSVISYVATTLREIAHDDDEQPGYWCSWCGKPDTEGCSPDCDVNGGKKEVDQNSTL